MPNLITDRLIGMSGGGLSLNVRRLMYQSLIWVAMSGDETSRMLALSNLKDLKCQADPLIDRMRRNAELDGNFLRRQMLVDKKQAIELAAT